MQNKGFVTFVTVSLALLCAFYLSFSPVARYYENKANAMGEKAGRAYLDSMANENVYLGMSLRKVRQNQIGLGLDLKGGMNVVLKLNAADLLRSLANNPVGNDKFEKALEMTTNSNSTKNFIDEFVYQYKKLDPNANFAVLFGNGQLRERINKNTKEDEIVKLLNEKYNSAVEASYNVLRNRIDQFGVVAPNIQRLEGQGRILVELPGVKNPERVRELLSRAANLQFWRTWTLADVQQDLIDINKHFSGQEVVTKENETTSDSTTQAVDSTKQVADSAAVATASDSLNKKDIRVSDNALFSLLAVSRYPQSPIVGYAQKEDINKINSMFAQARKDGFLRDDIMLIWGSKPIKDPETRKETNTYALYAIHGNRTNTPDLSGSVVVEAKSQINNQMGRTENEVSMRMNTEGAQKWARLTKENIGKSVAIVLDGVVYSAPNVNVEITGGQSSITGDFTVEEANDLANVLNSGKMDTSVVIEQESIVGPTLGAESINAGIISFAIALVLLMIYMCLAYGIVPGMVANVALVINSFFTMGILASFGAVLTLSGIAGLVLTLGMAVDANVLINERIKEELRKGKNMTRAIADGYGNAFSAIFDSNLTTIITGVVLFYFGTGPIRGFATTLIIGLVASFITAVFLTRMIFEFLDKKHVLDKVTYTTAMTRNLLVNNNFNILGSRNKGYILPVAILLAGLVSIFTLGLNKGIEFSGGRNYIVKFDQKVENDALRSAIAPQFDGKLILTSIGTEGDQVRVSTNYKIEQENESIEEEISKLLYQGAKGFYKTTPSFEDFVANNIVSSQKVSASMSSSITQEALIAVIISLIFMALYILIRFRNISFSIGAFASVTVTSLAIFAIYSLLWKVMPFTMEVDQNFVAAILAIIGYSINDVVIVFDRIREELGNRPDADRFEVINGALNSTLSRTLNTSFTTFLVMLIVFVFGGDTLRSFTFALLVGIVVGTYATLFVATPIAYEMMKRLEKRKSKA